MDYKLILLLIVVEILVISTTRDRVLAEIRASSLLIFNNSRLGLYIYSLIFLPGTLLHEFSHWIVAEILQVPTGKFHIFPDLESDGEGGEERLGYVMMARTGPIKGFLIGFAPLFVGLLVLVILGYTLSNIWGLAPLWQVALTIYGLVVVGSSMMVSRADRRNWPIIAILFALTIFVLWRLNLASYLDIGKYVLSPLTSISQALGLTIGLNLGMILGLYAVRHIIEIITGKKVKFSRRQ